MNKQHIFLYFISLFTIFYTFSQEVKKDTIILKETYGLRVGIDLFNPVATIIDSDRKGLELVADYRLNHNFYAASEVGFIDNFSDEDNFDFQTKGQYIKLGVNYNTYQNWLNMDNEIFLGFRYGLSTFSQTLNNFTINSDIILPQQSNTESQKFSSLNANWAELLIGMKVEVYSNIFLGFSFSTKKMLATKEPDNFKNLFVPGFNRVFLNDAGFGFNYTISYRLPLYKKDKIKATDNLKVKEVN
jgi:hypothetical protein